MSPGRRWAAAAVVLLGALVVTGRLLDAIPERGAGTAGGPATTAAAPSSTRPAGAIEAEGVLLAPTSQTFRAGCQQAADRVGFAVPCPQLLPIPAPGAAPPALCQEAGACRRDELLWFPMDAYVVPAGSTGAAGSLGALALLATPDPAARMEGWCPDQRPITAPALGGRPAVLAACPAGFQGWSSESVLLRWSRSGTFVTLGLRGPSEHNQRLAVTLAGHLRFVRPGG